MLTALAVGVALQLAATGPLSPPSLRDRATPLPSLPAASGVASRAGTHGHDTSDHGSDVEYSDWYYRRLDIHRYGSYAMLPLFLAQYYAGTQLEKGGEENWAEDVHPMLALGVGALFTSNTVTGAWNLWEGRKDPKDRTRRFLHAGLLLLADAGFVATGLLAHEAEHGGGSAGVHKTVAISSMAVATVGYALMLDVFRPD